MDNPNLSAAIAQVGREVEALIAAAPLENSEAWWELRAKSHGLTLLKVFKARELTPQQAEQFRKSERRALNEEAP